MHMGQMNGTNVGHSGRGCLSSVVMEHSGCECSPSTLVMKVKVDESGPCRLQFDAQADLGALMVGQTVDVRTIWLQLNLW